MNLNITFRNLEPSTFVHQKIREKATRLKKYFNGKVDIRWVCSVESERHISEINVHAGHRYFHAKAENSNIYKTLDEALIKIKRQIKKINQQLKNKIHRKNQIEYIPTLIN